MNQPQPSRDRLDGPRAADDGRLLDALDPEQRQVATSLGGPVAVWAGAGTGKTRAITHRIAWASATGVSDPRHTLAVTFTTRAAGEMRDRLERLGVRGVQARTFHSAALRQLQYFWPRVHGTELPPLVESRMALVAQASARNRLGGETSLLRDLAAEIGWAKVSNVTPGAYASLAEAAGRQVSGADPSAVARVLTSYEELKAAQGVIDFDDILLCSVALLAEHGEVAEQVRGQYRHLVVDEYQDVSPLQEQLLLLWLGEGDDLCVVGDPEQCIHSFAGARADFLTGFGRRHPGARTIRLVRNYRSTPQILRAANAVLAGASGGRARLVAERPDGPEPVFAAAGDEGDEADQVARWVQALHEYGVPHHEVAVLMRVRSQSLALEAALGQRGVPYQMRGAERFFERGEVRQLLPRVIDAAQVDPDTPGAPAVQLIAAELGWRTDPPEGAGQARERWESLNAVVGLAEGEGSATLRQVADELQRRSVLQLAPQGRGVTLSTIHAAKGLEWDGVALVGANEGTLPFVLATEPEQVAEERRLVYVALTRARRHLRVSWTTKGSGGRPGRRRSRFLDALVTESVAPAEGTERRSRRSRTMARCPVCTRPLLEAVDRKLGHHADCTVDVDLGLFEELREWRAAEAERTSMPNFVVFTDATLRALAERRPTDHQGMLAIPGIGRSKVERWGDQVLDLIRSR